jgi:hypothetical protein
MVPQMIGGGYECQHNWNVIFTINAFTLWFLQKKMRMVLRIIEDWKWCYLFKTYTWFQKCTFKLKQILILSKNTYGNLKRKNCFYLVGWKKLPPNSYMVSTEECTSRTFNTSHY